MKVTNLTKAPQGLRVGGQLVWVKPGTPRDLEFSPAEMARAKELTSYFYVGEVTEAGKKVPKTAAKGDEPKGAASKYEAKHRGGGSWSIMEGDKEVVEKLDKSEADKFNTMSDADKAAYVKSNGLS